MPELTSPSKARLRRQALRQRRALDPGSAAAASARIGAAVAGVPAWLRARAIHTYVSSLPNEVDTRGLIEAARARGVRVIVPVVVGRAAPLRHAEIGGLDELARDAFDLLQPARPRFVDDLSGVGLVLVPGVLFDRAGYRVGHGGGYYDRFLGGLTGAVTAGLIYDEFLVDRIPIEAHDVPVDLVVTPSGVHSPRPRESDR